VQLKLAPWELLFLEVVARSQRKETVVIGARWYLCSIAAGSHRVKFSGTAGHPNPRLGLWLGADQDLADRTLLASFRCSDPARPPYRDRLERQGICLMLPTAGRSGSA
jgi:hypothetical protein